MSGINMEEMHAGMGTLCGSFNGLVTMAHTPAVKIDSGLKL